MRRICDSCRHFATAEAGGREVCLNRTVVRTGGRPGSVDLSIEPARDVCNKEGDGRFVYFEPNAESAHG